MNEEALSCSSFDVLTSCNLSYQARKSDQNMSTMTHITFELQVVVHSINMDEKATVLKDTPRYRSSSKTRRPFSKRGSKEKRTGKKVKSLLI